jgi:hypothetical protein
MALLPQLFSGARGLLLINGKPMATVTNVNVSINDSVRAVHTFGAVNARSVEPLSTSASVSIGSVIPVNDPSGKPVNSSAISAGIEPLIPQMLTAEDITVEVQDKITGQTVAAIRNCRFTNRTFNLSAQSLANASLSLVGIYDSVGGNSPDKLGL